ncbi:MAG: hypothetical protein IT536_04925 [Hyphomicrobiales bacterium]|nr:hypothetical protein [Hyphomicrobiales bacterium]
MKHPQIIAAVAVALGVAALADASAFAQGRRPERVSITGCPYPGVTAGCLMIKGADGTVYNISSSTPRPRDSGRMVRVRGIVTDKLSACGQGIVLDRIRWTRTRLRCPN